MCLEDHTNSASNRISTINGFDENIRLVSVTMLPFLIQTFKINDKKLYIWQYILAILTLVLADI